MDVYVGNKTVGSTLEGLTTIVSDARSGREIVEKIQRKGVRVFYAYEAGACILRVPTRDFARAIDDEQRR